MTNGATSRDCSPPTSIPRRRRSPSSSTDRPRAHTPSTRRGGPNAFRSIGFRVSSPSARATNAARCTTPSPRTMPFRRSSSSPSIRHSCVRGFLVADTPGLASLNRRAPPRHAGIPAARRCRPVSHRYAAAVYRKAMRRFSGAIGEHVRTIFIVQTKIDLWRMQEASGLAAWEAARARIVGAGRTLCAEAEVFAVSAHEYAIARLNGDEALRRAQRFSRRCSKDSTALWRPARKRRGSRGRSQIVRTTATATGNRVRRSAELIGLDADALAQSREAAQASLRKKTSSQTTRDRDRTSALARGEQHIIAAGTALGERRPPVRWGDGRCGRHRAIADRGRFGALVDAALARRLDGFCRCGGR